MAKDDNVTVLDFSSVGPLPDDVPYLCMISKFENGTSSQGKPMISAEFTIEEPDAVGVKGRKLFRSFSLQDQALFALHGLLKALGETQEDLGSGKFELNADKYIGKMVTVYIANRESDEFGERSEPRRYAPESVYADAGVI